MNVGSFLGNMTLVVFTLYCVTSADSLHNKNRLSRLVQCPPERSEGKQIATVINNQHQKWRAGVYLSNPSVCRLNTSQTVP